MSIDVTSWRGVAQDEDAERTAAEGTDATATIRLRRSSRALLVDLLRPHRRTLWTAVGLLVLQNAASMAAPYLVMIGIGKGIAPLAHGDASVLIAVAAGFAVAVVTEFLAGRGFLIRSGRVGQSMLYDLRQRVYRHFQKLSISFHEKYTSGRMIARLTSDMDSISELVDGGIDQIVLSVLSVVSIAGILLWIDAPLAVVALLSFPFLLWVSNWFRVASAKAYRRTREAVALVIVHFVESLGGIRAVQAFRREPRNQEIFDAVNDDYRRANIVANRLLAIFGPTVKVIGNVTIAVVLVYGAYRALHGQIGPEVLAAFLLYLRRFFEPMQEISQFYNSLQSATAALEKLSGVLQEEPGVPEPVRPVPAVTTNPRGSVAFDHISFGYRPDRIVLPSLDLRVPAGQTVALVGPTGAGKSTVAKLVARFYDPVTGTLRLDGVDLRDLSSEDLRRSVVMVTQENFLFSGTIAQNIAFGRPDATRAQVEAAARAIGADTFIHSLPEGYDTDVRKRGGRLSAGQRQLVAFARGFLADPAVLILDEATSSLDIPSERLVQRAMRTILADRTAFVIAHRLSTVQIADRVLVIEDGRVVEDGPPARLAAAGGRYARLHQQWADSLV
ncbi:MAG TPA: ABC transporter ATP-binding protein [Micromonosporaceae bacterium]|jgi:ABC-type multidrug transport system fused ATPase/permease subunit